jgi:hypothetical protein
MLATLSFPHFGRTCESDVGVAIVPFVSHYPDDPCYGYGTVATLCGSLVSQHPQHQPVLLHLPNRRLAGLATTARPFLMTVCDRSPQRRNCCGCYLTRTTNDRVWTWPATITIEQPAQRQTLAQVGANCCSPPAYSCWLQFTIVNANKSHHDSPVCTDTEETGNTWSCSGLEGNWNQSAWLPRIRSITA